MAGDISTRRSGYHSKDIYMKSRFRNLLISSSPLPSKTDFLLRSRDSSLSHLAIYPSRSKYSYLVKEVVATYKARIAAAVLASLRLVS